MRRFAAEPAADYDHYLTEQLRRTFLKNTQSLLPRTKILVDLIIEMGKPSSASKILCIGCRNTAELDYFQSKGLKNLIGIDLFSENHRIQVMDMHDLTFREDTFDIVYSSHSLEHSYDIDKVAKEIIRVARNQGIIAIEVPVRYTTTQADRFDLKNVNGVLELFMPHINELLWSDDLEARTPNNHEGTPIVRVIFRIEKHNIEKL